MSSLIPVSKDTSSSRGSSSSGTTANQSPATYKGGTTAGACAHKSSNTNAMYTHSNPDSIGMSSAGPTTEPQKAQQRGTTSTAASVRVNGPPATVAAASAPTAPHSTPPLAPSSPPVSAGTSNSSSSNGCVRWCMNVALQSFTGEPWAVALLPIEEVSPTRRRSLNWNASIASDGGHISPLLPAATTTTGTKAAAAVAAAVAAAAAAASAESSLTSLDGIMDAQRRLSHGARGSSGGTGTSAGGGGCDALGRHNAPNSPSLPPIGGSGGGGMFASGLQLVPIDYSKEETIMTHPLDGAFSYDPHQEDVVMLQRCVQSINEPMVTLNSDDLLCRFTNIEFAPVTSDSAGEDGDDMQQQQQPDGQVHYHLRTPLEGMLNSTLHPAVDAVIDHCVNAVVLVYGATQEMKQMGLIGTPEECGLLPHGIRMFMDRYVERHEKQQTVQSSSGNAGSNCGSAQGHLQGRGQSAGSISSSASTPPATGSRSLAAPAQGESQNNSNGTPCVEDVSAYYVPGEDGSCSTGGKSTGNGQPATFQFPAIGSVNHQFARVEATFVAFDSTSVVDLLDLSNKHVELALQLGPPPTPSVFEESSSPDEGISHRRNSSSGSSSGTTTTDAFVLNARAMPAEGTNEALSALDVGLENLSHALEMAMLPSESGSSLLFSLTAYTDTCRCATFHVLCLAEDPAAQTWLASTALARSQAIPIGEEQSWASIQNTPMPPPLHHHAATMLVPALCFGNVFTSVLICVYNSITALARLNRDLTFAVTGHRMRTIPRVTMVSSRCSTRRLPPGWEEHFTDDGRRYYIDTTTHVTTWEDPRITLQQQQQQQQLQHTRSSAGSGGTASRLSNASATGAAAALHRPSRIGLGDDDVDFLAAELNVKSPTGQSIPPVLLNTSAPDIGIVVIDTKCHPRVVLNSQNSEFVLQYAQEQERLKKLQLEQQHREALQLAAELKQQQHEHEEHVKFLQQQQRKECDGDLESNNGGASMPVGPARSCSGDVSSSTGATAMSTSAQALSGGDSGTSGTGLALTNTICAAGNDDAIPDVSQQEAEAQERAEHNGGDSVANMTAAFHQNSSDSDDSSDDEGGLGGVCRSVSSMEDDFDTGSPHIPGIDMIINTARFYSNAMQEQIAIPSSPPCGTSVAGRVSCDADPSPTSTPSVVVSPVTIPPETQDLESLVEEFSQFFKQAYKDTQRIKLLEAELATLKEGATPAPSPVMDRNTLLRGCLTAAEPQSPLFTSPQRARSGKRFSQLLRRRSGQRHGSWGQLCDDDGRDRKASSPFTTTTATLLTMMENMLNEAGSDIIQKRMQEALVRSQEVVSRKPPRSAGAGATPAGDLAVGGPSSANAATALLEVWEAMVGQSREDERSMVAEHNQRVGQLKEKQRALLEDFLKEQQVPQTAAVEQLLQQQSELFNKALVNDAP